MMDNPNHCKACLIRDPKTDCDECELIPEHYRNKTKALLAECERVQEILDDAITVQLTSGEG